MSIAYMKEVIKSTLQTIPIQLAYFQHLKFGCHQKLLLRCEILCGLKLIHRNAVRITTESVQWQTGSGEIQAAITVELISELGVL